MAVIARWCYQHKYLVVVLWVAAGAFAGLLSGAVAPVRVLLYLWWWERWGVQIYSCACMRSPTLNELLASLGQEGLHCPPAACRARFTSSRGPLPG
jgi:hypothetical protein